MGKTLIIGGGIAGLTAGIYGQIAGLDCLIIEKNNFTGGNLTGWERKGLSIDNCMHWLTGTKNGNKLNEIWKTVGMLGDGVKIISPSVFYTVSSGGSTASLFRDAEKTRYQLTALSPEDKSETDHFINAVKICGKNRTSIADKATLLSVMLRYGDLNIKEMAEKFRNSLIRKLLTGYLGGDLSALALIFAYGAFSSGNGDVPEGGSANAAKRIESKYLSYGGQLITGCSATRITLENNHAVSVSIGNGDEIECDSVICCCDPCVTFGELLPKEYMPNRMKNALVDCNNTPIFSSIQAAFSCNSIPSLPQNTYVSDIEPLDIVTRKITELVIKPYAVNKSKTVLQALIFLYDEESQVWLRLSENKENYGKAKALFAEKVRSRLVSLFPEAESSIELLDVWTPATYKHYFNANNGAFLGFAMKPGRSLFYKIPPKIRNLNNVYLATQWQSIPGGLPTAALQAKKAVMQIVKSKRSATVH